MNQENNNIEIEDLEDAIAEFEMTKKDERGPTRKQLAKIEADYSDVLKGDVDNDDDTELDDVDKALMKRITKYIENVRLGNRITSSEYTNVRKSRDEEDDDDGEVRELDCNFDRNAGRHFSRMGGMFDE